MTTENLAPAEVFPPGEFIRDELEARDWTQQDLADIMDRPLSGVSQIIMGKRAITPDTAMRLAAAFGTSPEFWMNMESVYQLSKTESAPHIGDKAAIYSVAPVSEMVRRGWIKPFTNVRALETQLKKFFEVADLRNIPEAKCAARKSTSYETVSSSERAWHYRARWLARNINVDKFDPSAIQQLFLKLRELTIHLETIRQLPVLFAKVGIRLVILAHLEKTKLDGAALWLDDKSPVIALSLRFDRVDYFWFTLVHECVHIKNRDGEIIDCDLVPDAKGEGGAETANDVEKRTNEETAETLVPEEKLRSFIIRHEPLFSQSKIVRFAQMLGVHPGIVLGQLHRRGVIHWKYYRALLEQNEVRKQIVGHAITDGWGHQPGSV